MPKAPSAPSGNKSLSTNGSARNRWWTVVSSYGLAVLVGAVTVTATSYAFAAAWSPRPLPKAPEPTFRPVEIDDCRAEDLFQEGRTLRRSGRAEDAVRVTRSAMICVEKTYGAGHVFVAFVQNELAKAYLALADLERALRSSERAVELIARLHGGSSDHAKLIMTLASIHARAGRHREAEPFNRKAYDIARSASVDDPMLQARTARSLGITLRELSSLTESRDLLEEAVRLVETGKGADSEAYGEALLDLAGAHLALDEPDEASRLAENARPLIASRQRADLIEARAAIKRSSLGEATDILQTILEGEADSRLITAQARYHVAFIQILRGRFVEAEETLQQALTSFRQVVGDLHPAIARCQHSLAIVYNRLRRFDQAEDFYQEAIRTRTLMIGPDSLPVADTRKEYAHLLMERGDLDAAEEEARGALAIFENAPEAKAHSVGLAHSSLGFVLRAKGEHDEAARSFVKGLQLIEASRGAQSSDLPPGLIELGQIRVDQGRLEEAEQLLQRAMSIRERDGARTAWGVAKAKAALARLRHAEGRLRDALYEVEGAIEVIEARLDRPERAHTDLYQGETLSERAIFELYLTIAHRLREEGPITLASRMFEVAQLPNLAETSSAIARLSLRLAQGGDDLGRRLRRRQDALEDWRASNQQLTDVLARGGTSRRAQSLRDRLESLDQTIEDLDGELDAIYPHHVALTKPKAMTADKVQSLLKPDEAVLIQVTGELKTYLFLVTRTGIKVEETSLGRDELKRRVDDLRRGVDLGEEGVLGLDDFDVEAAHRLYQMIFAPLAEALPDVDHLMAVFDRDMKQLPPSILLRSAAPAGDYGLFRIEPSKEAFGLFRKLDYLVKHLTISTLPSIGALKALRERVQAGPNRRPFAAFGNPAFEGASQDARMPDDADMPQSQRLDLRRLASRRQDPLPASETELLALASLLDADQRSVFLGEKANETIVKRMDLEAYETIAFSTHVVIPSDLSRAITEPSLLLPVSDRVNSDDDGILTESEIAQLKLAADMVLLSTCRKSAPPNRPGAEALSELARAFLLAGARSLLVSHWGGERNAMQKLTESVMEGLRSHPEQGRAAALRQAMINMIETTTTTNYSHPAFWAAFEIVGEGRQ